MKRREALRLTTIAVGGSVVGAEFFLAGCKNETAGAILFSEDMIMLLDEIGETILPATDRSPGARAARIGQFMQVMVSDCYSEEEQRIFMNGINAIKTASADVYTRDFMDLTEEERLSLLHRFDTEANDRNDADTPHFFSLIKQLTLLGYFTSEPGTTQALRYNPIPGEFIGCIPYNRGDKAWA